MNKEVDITDDMIQRAIVSWVADEGDFVYKRMGNALKAALYKGGHIEADTKLSYRETRELQGLDDGGGI